MWSLYCHLSLLNCVPYVLTCQRALHAYVLTSSRANMPCVLTCSRAYVSCMLTCSCVNVPCVLTWLCVNLPCMFMCSRANVLTCSRALRAQVLKCQRAYMLTCERAPSSFSHLPAIFAWLVKSFDATFFSVSLPLLLKLYILMLKFDNLMNIFPK